jgi:hypothetical protein
MNRPIKLILISAAVAISGANANSLSLQEPVNAPASHVFSLTVEKGKPSGNYEAGTRVVVSADQPPPGSQFAGWIGDVAILANPFLSRTTATIPFTAVKITATYTEPSTTETTSGEPPAASAPTPAPATSSPSNSDQGWGG